MRNDDRRVEIFLMQFLTELFNFANRPEVRPFIQRYVASFIYENFFKPSEICSNCHHSLINVSMCPCCGTIYNNGSTMLERSTR